MRLRSAAWLLLVLALCAARAWGQNQPAPQPPAQPPAQAPAQPTGRPAEAPPTFTTEVKGTVPDLTGRWLIVAQVNLPQGTGSGVGVASFWEVAPVDGKPALTLRWVGLPPAQRQALDAANKETRAWEPTVADLQDVRDAWDTLPPEPRGAASVATTISGADAFSEEMRGDAAMKDSLFIVQQLVSFHPGPQRPMRDVLVYGAKERLPDGFRGNYASATVAAAPFPIPISFAGTFRMYRLESVPARGLLARLLGVFAGCGRRPAGEPAQ